jgi:hypothetical protein
MPFVRFMSQVMCVDDIIGNANPFLPSNFLPYLFHLYGLNDDISRLRVVTTAATRINHTVHINTLPNPIINAADPTLHNHITFRLIPPYDAADFEIEEQPIPDYPQTDDYDIPDHLLNPPSRRNRVRRLPTRPLPFSSNVENRHPNLP